MTEPGALDWPGPDPPGAAAELRRSYHDRIAAIRGQSIEVLRFTTTGLPGSARALLSGDPRPVEAQREELERVRRVAAGVDAEVVNLLALESPVARDLRLILATRDVTHIGLLCAGLCVRVAGRAVGAERSMVPPVPALLSEVARTTAEVLARSERAWAALSPDELDAHPDGPAVARQAQTGLVSALLDLEGVPMGAALDLVTATRAFERLVDHAEEVGERVHFVVGGPAPLSP
jgi:phosphate transport system protein